MITLNLAQNVIWTQISKMITLMEIVSLMIRVLMLAPEIVNQVLVLILRQDVAIIAQMMMRMIALMISMKVRVAVANLGPAAAKLQKLNSLKVSIVLL